MSPLDMIIFLFFILVTIKAATGSIEYWRDIDNTAAEHEQIHARTVRRAVKSPIRYEHKAVRTTHPVKVIRLDRHRKTSSRRQYQTEENGAA